MNQENGHHPAAAGTQAPQQGAGVEMSRGKTAGRQGDSDACEHDCGYAGQAEKLGGTIQCTTNLLVIVGNRGQLLVVFQLGA